MDGKELLVENSSILQSLCTPGVSKENGLVQAVGRVKIRGLERRQCRAG